MVVTLRNLTHVPVGTLCLYSLNSIAACTYTVDVLLIHRHYGGTAYICEWWAWWERRKKTKTLKEDQKQSIQSISDYYFW